MRISAKADYAVRVAAKLAAATPKEPVKGERLATAQGIPLKFLENILGALRTAGIVASKRGAEGGYLLAQAPAKVTVADVIRAVDGPLGAVRGEPPEDLTYPGPAARVVDVWIAARASLRTVLEHVTLADLANGKLPAKIEKMVADPEGAAPTLTDDHERAARVAHDAGQLLLTLRTTSDDPSEHRAAGDAQANVLILDALREARPDDPILSEESADDSDRLTSSRVWIVDPLDGTREFGEKDRDDWAVHVALVIDGVAAIGAVALPARGLVLASKPAPALPPRGDGPIRLVVSRTRPPSVTERVQSALDAELVPMGSAGAKTMAIVLGDADVYAHAGGQYQWDSAAPVAVARAAGLHTSRLDGSPLRYNEPDASLPDLLVCRPELAELVIAAAR